MPSHVWFQYVLFSLSFHQEWFRSASNVEMNHIQHSLCQHGIFLLHRWNMNGPKVTIFISLILLKLVLTLCTCATQNILRILPKICIWTNGPSSCLELSDNGLKGQFWALLTLHTSTTPVIRQLLPNTYETEPVHAPPFWEETSSMMFQNNYWTIIKHKFENFVGSKNSSK